MGVWHKIKPAFWDRSDSPLELFNYHRLWKTTFWSALAVTLLPLIFLAGVNFYQFEEQYALQHNELTSQVQRLLSTAKVQVAYFLDERRAGLAYVNLNNTFDQLRDPRHLTGIFNKLRQAFGGYVDLGLIDSQGIQQAYIGPYNLQGRDYKDQDWYREVLIRGIYISEVFLGHRNFPHFVIAVRHVRENEQPYMLRATIDTERLNKLINAPDLHPSGDIFLVNRNGVLQTPSSHFGSVLSACPLELRDVKEGIQDDRDLYGLPLMVGSSKVEGTPFTLVVVNQPEVLLRKWDMLRINILVLIALSMAAIVVATWWGCTNLVSRIFEADLRRAAILHEVEHNHRLASIGRLAAGVAHEINNPVAIINEKAGLMKDLLAMSGDFPQKDRLQVQLPVIQGSVKRITAITHRLLGFARHLPVKTEKIDLGYLIREVLGFLEREAEYRNVDINIHIPDYIPAINSDKGLIQQVLLNILNNALAAVDDGGEVNIAASPSGSGKVAISISDNGSGIAPVDLKNIFEPFFSTKGDKGTGLGLSITYGIVHKLGGKIEVESEPGQGTTFTVILPLQTETEAVASQTDT
jgi:two-component system, NtrC family, sensor kinase